MNIVLTRIKLKLLECAKAVAAVATPIISAAVLSIVTDLSDVLKTAIAGALTGGVVYATKNAK